MKDDDILWLATSNGGSYIVIAGEERHWLVCMTRAEFDLQRRGEYTLSDRDTLAPPEPRRIYVDDLLKWAAEWLS